MRIIALILFFNAFLAWGAAGLFYRSEDYVWLGHSFVAGAVIMVIIGLYLLVRSFIKPEGKDSNYM